MPSVVRMVAVLISSIILLSVIAGRDVQFVTKEHVYISEDQLLAILAIIRTLIVGRLLKPGLIRKFLKAKPWFWRVLALMWKVLLPPQLLAGLAKAALSPIPELLSRLLPGRRLAPAQTLPAL
jgi:hypothetical protein